MTNVVKCNVCSIVIDEMLSYIQNKVSVIDEETLVRLCTSSFSKEEIEKSKSLLFDSIPKDRIKIKRKNKGKEGRDLADIINIFKSTEEDLLPVYCARDLDKLPCLVYDHLDCSKLLKDIQRVQCELKDIKSSYVTQNQLAELKTEMLRVKNDSSPPPLQQSSVCNVNVKRGAWVMDSGHMGRSQLNSTLSTNNSTPKTSELGQQNISQDGDILNMVRVDESLNLKRTLHESCLAHKAAAGDDLLKNQYIPPSIGNQQRALTVTSSVSHSVETIPGPHSHTTLAKTPKLISEDGWQKVSRRRKSNYRYHGTAGTCRDNDGKFKAAETRVPIFITKVHKDTMEKDIKDYIYQKTQEIIMPEKLCFNKDKGHNAFKFFVSESKVSMFLDNKLWPQGIIFRRFINFTRSKMNGENTVFGLKTVNNG